MGFEFNSKVKLERDLNLGKSGFTPTINGKYAGAARQCRLLHWKVFLVGCLDR